MSPLSHRKAWYPRLRSACKLNWDAKEMLKLDNQLCFALYACSKEIIALYKPYLNSQGLTYTQYITLLVLWEEDGLNISELGNKLLLDSGTLTPLLKKLEKFQLVERVRDRDDERVVKVFLTEKEKCCRKLLVIYRKRCFAIQESGWRKP